MPRVCWEEQLCVSCEFVTINSRCMDFLRSTGSKVRMVAENRMACFRSSVMGNPVSRLRRGGGRWDVILLLLFHKCQN